MNIKNIIEKIKKVNPQVIFISFGILILMFIFWNRILRIRWPKKIPFVLDNYTFIVLSLTCSLLLISLILIIKSYFIPNKEKTFSSTFSAFYTESLEQLDLFIKRSTGIYQKLEKLHIFLYKYFHKNIKKSKQIYFLVIFPQTIPALILPFDVFYFQNISYFYYALFLLIIPLFYRYIYHSLHLYYCVTINQTERVLKISIEQAKNDKPIYYRVLDQPIHFFIQEITVSRLNIRQTSVTFKVTLLKEYLENHPGEDYLKIFSHYYNERIPNHSDLYEVLYTYTMLKKRYTPMLTVLTIINYNFCWFYILFTSNFKLSEDFINLILLLQNNL